MTLAWAIATIVFGVVICRTDWDESVRLVRLRLSCFCVPSSAHFLCARVLLCAHVLNNETGDRHETIKLCFFFLQRALRTAWPTLTIVHALLRFYFLHGMDCVCGALRVCGA